MVGGDELRAVMGRFPHGVAVVTVEVRGQRAGLTVASLVSLSLEPPLVGVAIRRDAALHELLRESEEFAVSLLAAGQEALWEGVVLRDYEGPPQLEGAVGWLRCRIAGQHETGDHTFFVGAVESAEPGPANLPLVFHRQAYAGL